MDNGHDMTFLGLILRAGFLEIGDESVGAAARRGKARVILSASDASENSKRRAQGYAKSNGAEYALLPWRKDLLGGLLGRGSPGMLAVTDAGMARSLLVRLSRSETGRRD